MRPADAYETEMAWKIALTSKNTPSVIITTRQDIPVLDYKILLDYHNAVKGGYIIKKENKEKIDLIILSSGSEVSLSLDAADKLEKEGFSVRVVSMFSMFLFDKQDNDYKNSILPKSVYKRMAIEAGSELSWFKYTGLEGTSITINKMGISGKAEDLGKYFGFTAENVYNKAKEYISK